MKLKHLFEYNLKTQDLSTVKQYEYIETENYIFLKLDKQQSYLINDLHDVLSTDESNNYLNNMVIPSKINKDTLIDFFDNNHEYFTRIIYRPNDFSYNFNNLKNIFNKNYMGYSDWDLCTSDIDLEYEMKHVLFKKTRHNINVFVHQGISFIKIPPTNDEEKTQLKVKSKSYRLSDKTMLDYTTNPFKVTYTISFIVRRK